MFFSMALGEPAAQAEVTTGLPSSCMSFLEYEETSWRLLVLIRAQLYQGLLLLPAKPHASLTFCLATGATYVWT